jgi:ABC-type Zn uptake system ZnuABC Zn-binding protein ZnuA
MTWLEHHKISEEYAQLAEAALRQQDPQQAETYYAQAAQAELLALAALDPTKTRTLGITVVSTVALSSKSQAFHQAEQTAYQWLATDALPPFAVQALRELLLDIWQQQPKPIAS